MIVADEKIRDIGKVLCDPDRPLKERFRALFSLRNIGGQVSVECISHCFTDSSALLKHELAYCLGQMQDKAAIPILVKVLKDDTQEPIVRHEAAEALGAIGNVEIKPILESYVSHSIQEISETAELALARLEWLQHPSTNKSENPYQSIDPTPPLDEENIEVLREILLDEDLPLFKRYQAMFSLRNMKSSEAALVLAEGLKGNGALFSHEIAFVLGQLQDKVTIPALIEALKDESKNEMVRHESAEALGAIATDECFDVLKTYVFDNNRVVRESCEVALDMCDYENSAEFQYALTL